MAVKALLPILESYMTVLVGIDPSGSIHVSVSILRQEAFITHKVLFL